MTKTVLNTIHCGDFLVLHKMLGDRKFDAVIADPPYNIGKDFGNGSDNQSMKKYIKWTQDWISICFEHLSDEGIVYVYGFPEILAHISTKYELGQQRWLVWHYTNKTVPQLKFWQRSHESILCLWRNKRPNLQVDLIREEYTEAYKSCIGKVRKETTCRYNTKGRQTVYNGHENGALPRDVIKIPALAGGAGRKERWFLCKDCGNKVFPPEEFAEHANCNTVKHPTQKPMELSRKLMNSAVSGNGVLIPFAGSGSECVVAQQLNHDFFATEINKEYVKLGNKWLRTGQ